MKTPKLVSLLRLLAVSALAALAATAHAQVVVSNISATHNNGVTYPPAPRLLAQSFTTDSSSAQFNLISVSLMFYQSVGTIGNFTVTVYGNDSGKPGSVLGTLSGNASPTATFAGQQETYTASGVTLNANTTYWVSWGFSSPNDDGATYIGTPMQDTSATGQWSLGVTRVSFDFGSSWAGFAATEFPAQISIQASAIAVPEPGTYAAIAGAAALGLAAWRRRRPAVAA